MLPVLVVEVVVAVVVVVVVLRVVAVRCLVGATLPHAAAIAATAIVLEAQLLREMKSPAELMTREIGVLPLPMERNVTFARVCLLLWMIWKSSPRHTWLTRQTPPRSMMIWILRILRTRGSVFSTRKTGCCLSPVKPFPKKKKLEFQQDLFSVSRSGRKGRHKFRKSLGNSHFLFSW